MRLCCLPSLARFRSWIVQAPLPLTQPHSDQVSTAGLDSDALLSTGRETRVDGTLGLK
jgi:hypothetical protein